MSYPCMIVDVTDRSDWECFFYEGSKARERIDPGPLRIPHLRRPSVLQPDMDTAQREAKRLAARYPGHRFAIFEARTVAMEVERPTHTTLGGQPCNPVREAMILGLVP